MLSKAPVNCWRYGAKLLLRNSSVIASGAERNAAIHPVNVTSFEL